MRRILGAEATVGLETRENGRCQEDMRVARSDATRVVTSLVHDAVCDRSLRSPSGAVAPLSLPVTWFLGIRGSGGVPAYQPCNLLRILCLSLLRQRR
jgi:hypothetical protein